MVSSHHVRRRALVPRDGWIRRTVVLCGIFDLTFVSWTAMVWDCRCSAIFSHHRCTVLYCMVEFVFTALFTGISSACDNNLQPCSNGQVVLNNFGDKNASSHVKLMKVTLQNMFPSINVATVKLSDCRRVVMFNLDKTTGSVEMRHFVVRATPTGITRAIKKVQTPIRKKRLMLRGIFSGLPADGQICCANHEETLGFELSRRRASEVCVSPESGL